jgi:hypothetical protein
MKVFHVFNYETGSWGFYQYIDLVVIAETVSAAIEQAKTQYPDYVGNLWKAEELSVGVNCISSSCS